MDGTTQQSNAWKTLFAVSLGVIVVNIDYWSVAVALPDMAKQFEVSTVSLDWVISAYIISFCATMSVAGRLGDIFGRKKLLLLGILIFGLVSMWVGLSDSFLMIVVARVALGIGAGLIYPLATAVLSNATSPSSMTKMLGLLTGVGAVGAAIGPVVGGILTETMGWQWIFYLNAPVSVAALFMVSLGTNESKDEQANNTIDFIGIIFLLLFIVSLALCIAKATSWGITSLPTISLGIGSVVFLYLFKKREDAAINPLVEIPLFKNRTFAGFVLGGSLSNLCWAAIIFTTTIMLQKVLSYNPLTTGLFFLSLSGAVAISSFFLSHVIKLIGAKSTMILSLVLQIMGCFILWHHTDPVWILIGLGIAGPGCGWGFSMALVGSITSLPKNMVGLASSAGLTIVIMTGGLGVTLAGAVIQSYSEGYALNDGIRASFIAGIIACTLGLLISAFFVPRIINDPQGD